jgi:hypothetical protein
MSTQEQHETPLEARFVKFSMHAFQQLPLLSGAEIKILLYIQRHTASFNIARRILSTDEFMHGRKRQDGSRMDQGTGLSNRAVIDALRSLAQRHLIFPAEEESGQKSYALLDCAPLTQPVKNVHRPEHAHTTSPVKKLQSTSEQSSQPPLNKVQNTYEKSSQVTKDEPRQQQAQRSSIDTQIEQFIDTQIDPVAAAPRSPDGSPIVSDEEEGREEQQEDQPDLMTLRVEYTALSHQLAQLDVNKQAGQWARLYRQVQAAEERLRQAEQDTAPSQSSPSETAKQRVAPTNEVEAAMPATETVAADERQARLRAITSDLLYWKGGLKVIRQAQLPKWRGSFRWQIEAKIETLQTEIATLRAEAAKLDG